MKKIPIIHYDNEYDIPYDIRDALIEKSGCEDDGLLWLLVGFIVYWKYLISKNSGMTDIDEISQCIVDEMKLLLKGRIDRFGNQFDGAIRQSVELVDQKLGMPEVRS